MSDASKLVVNAILGEDSVTVVVDGVSYFIDPPTIERIVKAAKYLDSVEGGNSLDDAIGMMRSLGDACKALSVFIRGDESLCDNLSKGTLSEVLEGLRAAMSLLSMQDFQMLSTLARSVARMVANPRP